MQNATIQIEQTAAHYKPQWPTQPHETNSSQFSKAREHLVEPHATPTHSKAPQNSNIIFKA